LNEFGRRLYLNWLSILSIFKVYPLRIVRILFHLFQWIPAVGRRHLRSDGIAEWIIEFGFYIMDIFCIPDLFEIILVWIQPNIRLLNNHEKELTIRFFGTAIYPKNIRMNDRMHKRIRLLALAFVSFNTIHFEREIAVPVLIHELVHIWQYQKFGSVYIYRALKAQNSKVGYDYGGQTALYHKMLSNQAFMDFNFEQQGEIFEDYCRMQESDTEQNTLATVAFEYFINQVRQDDSIYV